MANQTGLEAVFPNATKQLLLHHVSNSVEDTLKFAQEFATAHLNAGDVICLTGDLGAGKTHFTKGVAKAFEINPEMVQSPTFTLINEYEGRIPIYHFDLYRLDSKDEAIEIGMEDYLYDRGICLIEWPEKAPELLPLRFWLVEIMHNQLQNRSIRISQITHEA